MVFGFTGLWANAAVFLVAAAVIGVVGPCLSGAADRVGEVTGVGQTLAGALLLGASTSLPGLIVSFQTALRGRATLAVANSLGGIAAQTLFVAVADAALRSDTLEHRNALTASLMQSAVLVSLLTLLLIGMLKPGVALFGSFNPISLVVAVGVVLGFRMIQQTRKHPSWRVRGDDDGRGDADQHGDGRGSADRQRDGRKSADRRDDGAEGSGGERSGGGDGEGDGGGRDREDEGSSSTWHLFGRYAVLVVLVGVAGYLISSAAGTIISRTGFSPLVMGLTLTAVATSLPELVTAVASVRRGSVALAIGDIVGGNAFDTIMVAIADFAYLEGSIYRAVVPNVVFVAAVALLMTGVLTVGFVRRDRQGAGNIGIESYLVMAVYALGTATVLVGTVVPSPW